MLGDTVIHVIVATLYMICTHHVLPLRLASFLSTEILWRLQQTLCSEIGEECRFAIKCWGPSEKPIKSSQLNGSANVEEDADVLQSLKSDVETPFTFNT